uniref:Uncharacterized protein n=1 Tax=Timema shepardi TaxID=629360 RepID=A0A7R9ATA0_TIMSH|nr:unnamed protein product [Timema shepardi]
MKLGYSDEFLSDGFGVVVRMLQTRRGTGITGGTVLLKPDGPPDARPPTDTVLTGVVGQLPTSSYFRRRGNQMQPRLGIGRKTSSFVQVVVRMGMISRVRARLQSLHTLTKLDPRDQDEKTAKTERKVVADCVALPDGHVIGVTSQHTINTPHSDPGPPRFNHEHAKQRTLSRSLE